MLMPANCPSMEQVCSKEAKLGLACRAHALRISEPVAVAALAERVAAAPLALVAAAGGPPVRRVLEGFEASGALAGAGAAGARPALLLVGPEGDFTPAELAALAAAGGTLVGLGERRLREKLLQWRCWPRPRCSVRSPSRGAWRAFCD